MQEELVGSRPTTASAAGDFPGSSGRPRAQPPPLQQAERGDVWDWLTAPRGRGAGHQPSQGSPKPPPSRPAGGSKRRRRSQHAQPVASWVARWVLYLPVALLLALLVLGPCPTRQAARSRLAAWPAAGRAWRLGCCWGGVAVLLSAQVAYAKSRGRLGAALDGLYLLLLTGETRHVLPLQVYQQSPARPACCEGNSGCTRGPLCTLRHCHAVPQALGSAHQPAGLAVSPLHCP